MSEEGRDTIISRLRELQKRMWFDDHHTIQEAIDEILRLQGRIKVPKAPVPWDRAHLKLLYVDQDTSRAAAEEVEFDRLPMAKKIWVLLKLKGPLTCHQIEHEFNALNQTVSARLRDLQVLGYIQDSGKRRPARKGGRTEAIVWEALDE